MRAPERVRDVKATLDATASDVRAKQQRSLAQRSVIAVAGLIAVVVAVDVVTHGNFVTAGNLTNVLRQITANAILAIGQTFVIITGGIDLSVGSLIQLTGVVMATFANAMPFGGAGLVVATLAVGIAVGGLAGFINALPVVRLGLPPFITTLAMMLMARGLAFKLAHGQPVPLASDAFNGLGTGYILTGLFGPNFPGLPVQVLWMVGLIAIFATVLARTRYGRYVYALGGNEEAARLAGIDTRTVKTLVYVISGACAGVAGLLLMSRFASGSPNTGVGAELQSIAAVVVGGTSLTGGRGNIIGTFLGALLIGVLNNVMNLANVESYTQEIVLGAVILVAVIIDELRKRYLKA